MMARKLGALTSTPLWAMLSNGFLSIAFLPLALPGIGQTTSLVESSHAVAQSVASPATFVNRLQACQKITIVAMGTSLTGGKWRWPDVMMDEWLDKDFPGQVRLFNEGEGASASSVGPGGNAALSGLGKLSAALSHKPDVVFIEFTTNDAYLPYKISLEDSKKNLNMMIDQLLAANSQTEVILQTMNPVVDKPDTPSATDRPKLADYVEGYRQVAKARGLLLVDNYVQWLKLLHENPVLFDRLVPDGVHPQAEGYRLVLLPDLKLTLIPAGEAADNHRTGANSMGCPH